MTDIRVRLVTWDDEPALGGQGIYVRGLRSALIDRGISVSTTAGRGPYAISYRRISGRGHLDMSIALNRFPRVLFADEPGVLHISGGPGGIQLMRRSPVPVVYTAHHTYLQSHRRGVRHAYGAVEAGCYRRSAMVAAVSPSTADAVMKMGLAASRVVVIPPGIAAVPPRLRHERDPEAPRILFVGRLEAEKGPLDAVTAMRRVLQEMPTARGTLIGSGSLARCVCAAVRSAGSRMTFRGRVSEEELAREYQRADIVLMPSAYEGLGFVALEAMASGAVVVCYKVPGLRGTVGPHGILVPPGDVAGLSAACLDLLKNPRRRVELAASAREAVLRRHSWDRCAAEFEELYRRVLEPG